MGKIFLKDIAASLSKKKGLSQNEAEAYIEAFFSVIDEGLQSDKIVKVKGFGTFKLVDVRDRESVDVNTGDRVVIEGHTKVTFTPESSLKELVNKPFSQFETVELNDGVDFEKEQFVLDDLSTDASSVIETPDVQTPQDDVEEERDSSAGTPDGETLYDASPQDDNSLNGNTLSVSESTEQLNDYVLSTDYDSEEDIKTEEPNDRPVSQVGGPEVDADVQENDEEPVVEETDITENSSPGTEAESEITEITEDNSTCVGITSEEIREEAEPQISDVNKDKGKRKRNINCKIVLLIAATLILVAGVFLAGYYMGVKNDKIAETRQPNKMFPPKPKPRPVVKPDTVLNINKDTVATETKVAEEKSADDVKPVVGEVKTMSESHNPSLRNAEAIVRTGAYRIVGTDKQIKVKSGEDMQVIARHYLGEGMECYIQVHNNKIEVKQGETINIPKLELKKKGKNKKVS